MTTACGVSKNEMMNAYFELYDERLVAFPFYFDSAEGQQRSKDKIKKAISTTLSLYDWKYYKMVETMGFVYNPIQNYDMVENGTDTKTFSGVTTKEHSINATKIGSIKITGKAKDITIAKPGDPIGEDSEETYDQFTITAMDIDEDGRRKTMTDATSDTRSGSNASRGTPAAEGADGVPAIGQGTPVKTSNYITTMDDASTSRLHDYSEGQGTTAQGFYSDVVDDVPAMAEITAGNPAFASYTDTETHGSEGNPRVDTMGHSFTRKGNIGVTTT